MNRFKLSKYIYFVHISWNNSLVYRVNFLMWRVRSFLQLVTIYFFWSSVLRSDPHFATYSSSSLLTYILGTSLIRAVVLGSRSIDAQGEIASGDLNNHLLKPFNYFFYWVARDIADKTLNTFFSIIEITLMIAFLKPALILQTNPPLIFHTTLAIFFAAILYFVLSFIISMTTFWYYQHNGWAQRFLSIVILESLAGGMFPLDIFSTNISHILTKLPFSYFIHFPLQIYLGRLSLSQIFEGYLLIILWLIFFLLLANYLWHRGLKIYGAYGR